MHSPHSINTSYLFFSLGKTGHESLHSLSISAASSHSCAGTVPHSDQRATSCHSTSELPATGVSLGVRVPFLFQCYCREHGPPVFCGVSGSGGVREDQFPERIPSAHPGLEGRQVCPPRALGILRNWRKVLSGSEELKKGGQQSRLQPRPLSPATGTPCFRLEPVARRHVTYAAVGHWNAQKGSTACAAQGTLPSTRPEDSVTPTW